MAPYRKAATSALTLNWVTRWFSVVVVSFAALLLALGAPFIFGHKLQAGEVAARDYVAAHKAVIIDLIKTEQARDAQRENTLPVFRKDPQTDQAIIADLHAQLNSMDPSQPGAPAPGAAGSYFLTGAGLPYAAWRAEVESAAQRYLDSQDLLPGQSETRWQKTLLEFLPQRWPAAVRTNTALVVAKHLRPNVVIDSESTQQLLKEKIAHTPSVTREVEAGTVIVPHGEILTADDISVLDQLGIAYSQDLHGLLGITTALVTAFFLFGVFLFHYEPQFFFAPSAIALMATVCVVTCGIASAVGHEFPQFVPMPAAALVLSVIFGRRVSIILTILVILFLRVSDLADAPHLVALTAASAVALSTSITKRNELMLTGVLIGVIQSIAYFFVAMLAEKPGSAMGVGRELAQNLLGGLSSSIVAIGSLPFLEIIFGILTPFRVAELSEPDQPLLRQLEEHAPGTYQHSLAVANLAESGAKSIGADVNLVRAGAMYHDIGKMVTPKYFIENQLGGKNPHDDMTPEDSRARVLAHVTNGLDLARKYGLPQQIQAFIPEHQGTTIMAYFFHKACTRDGFQNVPERDYRYPGPKPQTKETAIVMLADVSEAVTHSLRDPEEAEVSTAIANVFKARWDDGQFNESGLSEPELGKVQQAFVRVWRTLHHERLKYPSTTTGRMPVPPQYSQLAAGGEAQTEKEADAKTSDAPLAKKDSA